MVTNAVHVMAIDQKATRRKIQPVVWDKGSQSAATGISTTGRGTKLKRGDAPRRGRYLCIKQQLVNINSKFDVLMRTFKNPARCLLTMYTMQDENLAWNFLVL